MNGNVGILSIAALSLLLLSGCAQTDSSAKRHAIKFVYTVEDSDPNFMMNRADSIRMATPFFEQFWQLGKKDRTQGISSADAQKRVSYFHSDEFIKSISGTSRFAGKEYKDNASLSPRWRNNMSEAVAQTYMDGYLGKE
ncbi:Exc2 family lipoprotein [Pantoea sp. At-9b]|uniref:Exc2 family lipoprotein n=1 Tax=Pantoea sp. (strain At-9b) TaxID=592316 RepID=UPI0001B401EE|nr:Exc2 family lipoprotein [Pantoea sp. At-9b]ADU72700.1 entry exclusion protein 2 [Pantoea sp. At-9b]